MTQNCSICWNVMNKLQSTTRCNHTFCTKCLFRWLFQQDRHYINPNDNGVLHGTCPICRQPIYMVAFSKTGARDFDIKGGLFTYIQLRLLRGTKPPIKIFPML